VNLTELAEQWGTPAYVYDRADARRAYRDLRDALPDPSRLYYSIKANPHPDVAGELAVLGCHAEIASQGEVTAALAAGFGADHILMTGPGKSRADIDRALEHGIRRFSVDSPADLTRVGARAVALGADVHCLLRVNADQPVPGMGLSMTGTASAFGADASWVLARPELFQESGNARVTGLHLYMGTNIQDIDVLTAQFVTSIQLASRIRDALRVPLAEVDLGGGFGMPYARVGLRPDFTALRPQLEPLLSREFPGWRDGAPVVSFESGRYLVGGCGWLLCEVLDVKVSKGRTFVVLNSGINHLGGMSGLRRIPRIVPDLVMAEDSTARIPDATVAGPLCTPLDCWSQQVWLPATQPGDLVAVPNVGAYGLTASLIAFLGHPPARELVLDNSVIVSVSQLTFGRNFHSSQCPGQL
jgi:diaminopimelate decarboxylase